MPYNKDGSKKKNPTAKDKARYKAGKGMKKKSTKKGKHY